MTDEKLAECLLHFDHYLEVSGIRARADKVGRLELGDDPGEKETDMTNVQSIGEAAKRVVEGAA